MIVYAYSQNGHRKFQLNMHDNEERVILMDDEFINIRYL